MQHIPTIEEFIKELEAYLEKDLGLVPFWDIIAQYKYIIKEVIYRNSFYNNHAASKCMNISRSNLICLHKNLANDITRCIGNKRHILKKKRPVKSKTKYKRIRKN